MPQIGFQHVTVFQDAATNMLHLKPNDIAVDCTGGGGGHTAALLNIVGAGGKILTIDKDPTAIKHLSSRFEKELASGQLILKKGPFSDLHHFLEQEKLVGRVNGILADLGVSSPQLDLPERGFSFQNSGPLDMRMNPEEGEPLSKVLLELEESEITDILFKFGEEPKAKFIAKAIKQACDKQGEITTTSQLADVIKKAVHYKQKSKKHPATKSFQAFRIYLNKELEEVSALLDQSLQCLAPNGRISIITFHSLEDRIVKQTMKHWSQPKVDPILKKLPVVAIDHLGKVQLVKPFPVKISLDEANKNSRSRSAKLRVCQKSASKD